MSNAEIKLDWDPKSLAKYQEMICKIPLFHREIARQVVDKKAVINARERGAEFVGEQDIVRAFLTEVPKTFYSLMVRLFEEVGFDYKQFEEK